MIPHLGPKVSGSRANLINRLKLPIVPVDDISVENLSNGQILSIFGTPGDTLAVALDTRSTYSFLPLQTVINLAIQTNALYNTELNRWIVECETVRKANAFINFSIANVNVQVPLNSFLFDAYASSNQTLNFSDGLAACYLAFLPDSQQGYSSFGIPFVTNIYLAVDNTNNKVAIANVNKNVSIALSDFDQASPTSLPISDFLPAGVNESTSSGASVAFMKSDIPFASLFTLPANLTLTYLQASVSGGASESIPARFSGISISNGEIYIGNTIGTLGVLPGASAALASSTSSKGNGNRLGFNNINNNNHIQGKVMVWTSIAFCFLISILLL